jgi:4-hydroxy-4-methyl-2-oxoglutarate aldolase
MMEISREQLVQLAAFDTPTIANGMESLGISFPSLGSELPAVNRIPRPIVGIAVTGVFRQKWGADRDHLPPWLGFLEAIERSSLPTIAVMDDASTVRFRDAMIGEGMARAMMFLGAVGAICNGVNRDIEGLRQLQFPLLCRGLTPDRGLIRFWKFQVPVEIGPVSVNPGDLIHADENGALRIPRDRVREVLEAAGQVAKKEKTLFLLMSEPGFSVAKYEQLLQKARTGRLEPAGELGSPTGSAPETGSE